MKLNLIKDEYYIVRVLNGGKEYNAISRYLANNPDIPMAWENWCVVGDTNSTTYRRVVAHIDPHTWAIKPVPEVKDYLAGHWYRIKHPINREFVAKCVVAHNVGAEDVSDYCKHDVLFSHPTYAINKETYHYFTVVGEMVDIK